MVNVSWAAPETTFGFIQLKVPPPRQEGQNIVESLSSCFNVAILEGKESATSHTYGYTSAVWGSLSVFLGNSPMFWIFPFDSCPSDIGSILKSHEMGHCCTFLLNEIFLFLNKKETTLSLQLCSYN